MIQWNAVKIQLGQLSMFSRNPRTITNEKYESLRKSLDELGIFRPFILDFDQRTVLGGNQRSKVLLEEFPTSHEVICMVPDRELTSKEKEKVVLMDNGHFGQWDFDTLANFELDVDEIKALDIDIKIPDVLEPEDLSDVNKEIDTDNFGNDLNAMCPRCSFEFEFTP